MLVQKQNIWTDMLAYIIQLINKNKVSNSLNSILGEGTKIYQEVRNSIQLSHIGDRNPTSYAVICCIPGSALTGNWNW